MLKAVLFYSISHVFHHNHLFYALHGSLVCCNKVYYPEDA